MGETNGRTELQNEIELTCFLCGEPTLGRHRKVPNQDILACHCSGCGAYRISGLAIDKLNEVKVARRYNAHVVQDALRAYVVEINAGKKRKHPVVTTRVISHVLASHEKE